jgi:hypothetical protein
MAHTQSYPRTSSPVVEDTGSGVGWALFSGTMLMLLGAFQGIIGLVALMRHTYYLVTSTGLVVTVDYTIWGWVHLLIGVAAAAAGIGVLFGQTWARVIGIILAALSAVANMAFLAAYPVWSLTIIAVDVVVIYALAVHKADVREE